MTCANPNTGYRLKETKNKLCFDQTLACNPKYEGIVINCRKCTSCRIHSSKQWAIRCALHANMYDNNSWLTLTYNPENLPEYGSLNSNHLKDFLKRLRKKYVPNNPREDQKITYFACGEYGDKNTRPHYHVCLFNFQFPDTYFHRYEKKTNIKYYRSPSLERLWTFGYSDTSVLTIAAAAYTARYCLKKKFGDDAKKTYIKIDTETGEDKSIQPEFVRMSTAPAIGKPWYEKYYADIEKDYIMFKGQRHSVPHYFDKLTEKRDPELLAQLKIKRRAALEKSQADNTLERRWTKNTILTQRVKRLIRTFEEQHND